MEPSSYFHLSVSLAIVCVVIIARIF